jgi:hypothetical protein
VQPSYARMLARDTTGGCSIAEPRMHRTCEQTLTNCISLIVSAFPPIAIAAGFEGRV